MQAPLCLVAVCFLLGAALGGAGLAAPELCVWLLPTLCLLAALCWRRGRERAFICLVLPAYGSAGTILRAASERSLGRRLSEYCSTAIWLSEPLGTNRSSSKGGCVRTRHSQAMAPA